MSREPVVSVKISDCEVQTFSAGGKGGQNQNRRSTGVRIIHHPSGARGECREERSQRQNKVAALKRLAATQAFRTWLNGEFARIDGQQASIEAAVDSAMRPENLDVETYTP